MTESTKNADKKPGIEPGIYVGEGNSLFQIERNRYKLLEKKLENGEIEKHKQGEVENNYFG